MRTKTQKIRVADASQHAKVVLQVMSDYARRRSSLSVAALAGSGQFVEWQHYPSRDAVDGDRGSEFYYHTHSRSERPGDEHGHFHVFARPRRSDRFHHLVAISLNHRGLPNRLFLTNQWVTGENWIESARVRPLLARFDCQLRGRLSPVSRWITGMLHLYADDIQRLHEERDRWHMRQQRGSLSNRHFSDRRWHVLAQRPIDIARRLSQVLN